MKRFYNFMKPIVIIFLDLYCINICYGWLKEPNTISLILGLFGCIGISYFMITYITELIKTKPQTKKG